MGLFITRTVCICLCSSKLKLYPYLINHTLLTPTSASDLFINLARLIYSNATVGIGLKINQKKKNIYIANQ